MEQYKGLVGLATFFCVTAIAVVIVASACGELLIAGAFSGVALVWTCVLWYLIRQYKGLKEKLNERAERLRRYRGETP
jgi:uncharacterized membrane protein